MSAVDCSNLCLFLLACRAIVDELNYSISQIDPKKTIHVGGFRLKPDGSLTDKKVATSVNHVAKVGIIPKCAPLDQNIS